MQFPNCYLPISIIFYFSSSQVDVYNNGAHLYDFHVAYSFTYKVPVLYFRGYKSGISILYFILDIISFFLFVSLNLKILTFIFCRWLSVEPRWDKRRASFSFCWNPREVKVDFYDSGGIFTIKSTSTSMVQWPPPFF